MDILHLTILIIDGDEEGFIDRRKGTKQWMKVIHLDERNIGESMGHVYI